MAKPYVLVIDCDTKKEVYREMTNQEYDKYLEDQQKSKSLQTENEEND
jgi:hypothetical protein